MFILISECPPMCCPPSAFDLRLRISLVDAGAAGFCCTTRIVVRATLGLTTAGTLGPLAKGAVVLGKDVMLEIVLIQQQTDSSSLTIIGIISQLCQG